VLYGFATSTVSIQIHLKGLPMFIQKLISAALLSVFGFLAASFYFDGLYGLATIHATTAALTAVNAIQNLWS
jgi:hypothetical protein